VFQLPAGPAQLAVGYERRDQRLTNEVAYLATGTPPLFLTCQLAQETCTNVTEGDLSVDEFYGELFLPVVADAPGVKALNFIIGTRYSNYDRFGSTTNSKIGVEYRPIDDVLVRASYAEVFRAPTISDLFGAITANAPVFNDPCTGLTSAQVTANPNYSLACENVAPDSGFAEPNGQVTGRILGNTDLEPETGDVLTYGVVYDPDWAEGLTMNVDFWNYSIDDTIEVLDVNTTATICVATGFTPACDLIHRAADGTVDYIDQPVYNLGSIDANGVDIGTKYALPFKQFGQFRVGLDATYTGKWERNPAPGFTSGDDIAGTFSRQDGNFADWRGTFYTDWSFMNFSALATVRYISGLDLEDPDGAPGIQPTLKIPAVTYVNLTGGYDLPAFKSNIRVGIDNVADKQPPFLYQNNVINANTDVNTYDTIGRFYWVKFTQSF
jgi:outer membrane receptor protein involved in Fe transport